MIVKSKLLKKAYAEKGLDDVSNDIVLMNLPKNQEEIDKIFQITGYIEKHCKMYKIRKSLGEGLKSM